MIDIIVQQLHDFNKFDAIVKLRAFFIIVTYLS